MMMVTTLGAGVSTGLPEGLGAGCSSSVEHFEVGPGAGVGVTAVVTVSVTVGGVSVTLRVSVLTLVLVSFSTTVVVVAFGGGGVEEPPSTLTIEYDLARGAIARGFRAPSSGSPSERVRARTNTIKVLKSMLNLVKEGLKVGDGRLELSDDDFAGDKRSLTKSGDGSYERTQVHCL